MKIKKMKYGKEIRTELLCKDKYKNYNYYILNLGTHPTAYIEIPKENKLYRKSYNEIYKIGCDIDVNGGLTYSDNELMGVKSENWFIGWDYAHCGDYYGYEEYMPESIRTYGKKWTTEEIIEEPKKIEKIEIYEDEDGHYFLNNRNDKIYIRCDETDFMVDKFNELIDEINNLKEK